MSKSTAIARCSVCARDVPLGEAPAFCEACGSIAHEDCLATAGCLGCRRERAGSTLRPPARNTRKRGSAVLDMDATPVLIAAILAGAWLSAIQVGVAIPSAITVSLFFWAARRLL